MAAKKEKIDPRALKLKGVREKIAGLEKEAKALRTEILKDYDLGVHPGFVILEKSRSTLDQDLLEAKLGSLDPYRTAVTATYIEFPKV